jgi:hypothetical protein
MAQRPWRLSFWKRNLSKETAVFYFSFD